MIFDLNVASLGCTDLIVGYSDAGFIVFEDLDWPLGEAKLLDQVLAEDRLLYSFTQGVVFSLGGGLGNNLL
jgi:hypothetical protein